MRRAVTARNSQCGRETRPLSERDSRVTRRAAVTRGAADRPREIQTLTGFKKDRNQPTPDNAAHDNEVTKPDCGLNHGAAVQARGFLEKQCWTPSTAIAILVSDSA